MQTIQPNILVLSDRKVLGDRISVNSLESADIDAIDLESNAIVRALREEKKAQEDCFALVDTRENKNSLCVFLHHQKIFFYQERNSTHERLLKLFKINFPNLTIEKYYDVTNELIKKGSALWNEACPNFLVKSDASSEAKKIVMKSIGKTILYGLVTVLLLHGILLGLLHWQDEKISALEDNVNSLQPILILKAQTETLNKLLSKQEASLQLLENIKNVMPDGVFLNAFDYENNQAFLMGKAETAAQIDTLLSNVKANKTFLNPVLKTKTEDQTTPPYHFNFVIQAGVQ